MPQAFRTYLVAIVALIPAVAFAAPVKKAHKTTTTTTVTTSDETPAAATRKPAATADGQSTLLGGMGKGSTISQTLHGLSLFAMYDFSDTLENTNGRKYDTERAFDLGASYETAQFAPGIAAQLGAQYDFGRSLKVQGPGVGEKISQFVPFAELTAHLTPAVKLMGGLNYNFPSVDNSPGATWKGNVGYQLGGSFEFTRNIALDARYRSVQYDYTPAGQGQVQGQSVSLKENGFTMGGRFMF